MQNAPTPYYEDEHVTLYCGDCRDVMPTLPKHSAGLLVTDPPYGMGYQSGARKQSGAFSVIEGDKGTVDVTGLIRLALEVLPKKRHVYVFQQPMRHNVDWSALPLASSASLIWDKGHVGQGNLLLGWGPSHEEIVFAVYVPAAYDRNDGKGNLAARLRRGTILHHSHVDGNVLRHPTEKPVPLLRELIEMSSKPGDVVLDPFAGVGSTLVAAVLEGRRAIGIELDENYCRIAVERLQAIQPHLAGLRGA